MSFLSDEELDKLSPAQSALFPSPIPVQSVSSDEFVPAPQWQIEALRRLEIPEELRKKYGYAPLGAADGPVKNAIFGGNNARLYNFTPAQRAGLVDDKLAKSKAAYEREGAARTNLAYGFINPGFANQAG